MRTRSLALSLSVKAESPGRARKHTHAAEFGADTMRYARADDKIAIVYID
jgi:hypothetical protein